MANAAEPVTANAQTGPQEVVILIHGIRTFATWQPMVKMLLEQIPNTTVVSIKFGYLDAISFWFPFLMRRIPIRDVRREIQNVQRQNPTAQLSVIAHSFGTYAITQILKDTPNIVLHRLVLCGSIVRRRYRWEEVGLQVKSKVINDCGARDIWPVLAKCFSWGYGDTGRHGFGRAAVDDRHHDFAHSDFFTEDFVHSYWKSWFEEGKLVPSKWEAAPRSPLWLSTLSFFPVKTLSCVFVAGVIWLLWFLLLRIPSYDGSLSDYLQARDAVGRSVAAINYFFEHYAPRRVKWEGYVVEEVDNGYYINPEKSDEPKALLKCKSGAFKPAILAGRYISFEGVVHGDIDKLADKRILKILDAVNLKESAHGP